MWVYRLVERILKKIEKNSKKVLTYVRGGAIIIKSPRYGSDKNLKKH